MAAHLRRLTTRARVRPASLAPRPASVLAALLLAIAASPASAQSLPPIAPAPGLLAQTAPKYATVTAKTCSIYEAPDEGAKVKAKVKRGEVFEVGGIRGQWLKVRSKSGVVGYVVKTDVVPGKKDLAGAAPASTPRPTGGGTGIGSGVTVEGRTGLLAKAGLAFAGNSYGFKSAGGFSRDVGMKTAYAGIHADVDYWFIPLAGAHGRFSSSFGSMTAVLREPINKRVDRIPTNINVIEVDAQGRYFIGDGATAPSVLGRLGFHSHEMRIDPVVNGAGEPLFLVSNTYQGLVIGVGGDVPVGGPQMGARGLLSYWLAPTLTEGSTEGVKKPSGKPKGASGLGLGAGFYYNLNDQIGLDAGIEYASFTGSFSGTGRRFNSGVRSSKTTDTYVLFLVNGTYRF